MARLREIPRTAAFAWSPGSSLPFLATGTKAGAVDADFSNDTQLELWDLGFGRSDQAAELSPSASVETDSRFHDIAWVQSKSSHTNGVIAGALENGSLDLWDVEKLLSKKSNPLISRTTKHSGAIKSLQFNPFRSELLATAGAKGELYISDLNNVADPFRLGNAAGRADDFECLDWNKKVAHIMVTGSNGGFVTVWDVKTKKESLTLNNQGRKPVSAVAWDPEKPTRLITATPLDTDPVILVWDLRNSNAPEKVLRGHDGGILSLSWCKQDNDLLLSCGKDNRTLCWNPQSGESYGEFPVVTNWTFQTRWNPHNPSILATASFDGKIAVHNIQNTQMGTQANNQAAPLDGEDFFAKASAQPQASSFSLPNPPEWMKKQTAVSFGFGGKVISVNSVTSANDPRRSTVKISNFVVDDEITSAVRAFSKNIQEIELTEICETRVEETFDNEKKDWEVIKTLVSNNPRKELINSLGFLDDSTTETITQSPLAPEDKKHDTLSSDSREQGAKNNRLSSFFDRTDEDDNFLADLASTKRAKTNNPFQIYADSESTADKQITRALMLGQFDKAMQVCLEEDRLSDAFMIAVCGGKSSIEKVQQAYFKKQASGPRYLRLLASVVGKNLWDVVYNADLANWKEVMATLCTYASSEEFPDLCESLGDRLEEQSREGECQPEMEQSASFCYIAGSKLEKVVPLWIAGLEESQKEQSAAASRDNSFSIHARGLQRFVEKVTVFRKVTQYQDTEQSASGGWKLAPLYEKYLEYADIVAAQGQLDVASEYLDLLPSSYPAADVARNRVKQATKKTAMQPGTRQATTVNTLPDRAAANTQSAQFEAQQAMPAPSNAHTNNPYAPSQAYYRPNDNRPSGGTSTYMPSRQSQQPITRSMIPPPPMVGAPPSTASAPPSKAPPSKSASMSNWNDTPDDFFKPPSSRRGTPAALTTSVAAPFPGSGPGTPPASNAPFGNQGFRTAQPAPPPPRGPAPPQRTMTPGGGQMPERPSSTATNAYAPQPGAAGLQQPNVLPQISRGPSPYNVPPPSGGPPPGSRYAPAPAPAPGPSQQQSTMNAQRPPPPPNPYAARPAPPTSQAALPPMGGPPRGTTPSAAASTPPPPAASKSAQPKYPPGDRSHIPATALPIFEILSDDMQRVKGKAPTSFKSHVVDAEKRLDILFDNLNNETLLKPNTIQDMIQLANALKEKNYDTAQSIHLDILTNRTDECGNWMTGVKRLIGMSRATP